MLRLDLTNLACSDCGDTLGFSGIYALPVGDSAICGFCAHKRSTSGQSEGLRAVAEPGPYARTPERRSGLSGEGEPYTQREAAALMLRLGAQVVGTYQDDDGRRVGPNEARALALGELGEGGE